MKIKRRRRMQVTTFSSKHVIYHHTRQINGRMYRFERSVDLGIGGCELFATYVVSHKENGQVVVDHLLSRCYVTDMVMP